MGDSDGACVQTVDPSARRQLFETGGLGQVDKRHAGEGSGPERTEFIAVVEGRPFLSECISRSIQSMLSAKVVTYSTLSELEGHRASAAVIIFSLIDASSEACAKAFNDLSKFASNRPVIVLAPKNDADLARAAIRHGAKGYIPVSMAFEIAVEAVRFVMAGGAYVPADCVLAASPQVPAAPHIIFASPGEITRRERAVVRAIQQGKPNKVIAYDLNMCESTVKVHVRNVMKKWGAKNRTEIAMRAQNYFGANVQKAA